MYEPPALSSAVEKPKRRWRVVISILAAVFLIPVVVIYGLFINWVTAPEPEMSAPRSNFEFDWPIDEVEDENGVIRDDPREEAARTE